MAQDLTLDINTIKNLTGATSNVAALWLPLFNDMLPKNGIDTKERLAAFLSQLGHESGGLLYTREIADGSAYEGRKDLGNTQAGDGKKFRGRGLIQITGRSNYQAFKDKYGVDVINNPDLLGGQYSTSSTPEQLKNSLLASIWFWNRANLNNLADKFNLDFPVTEPNNTDTITRITKVINGGTNGLSDRMNKFEAGRDYLKKNATLILSSANQVLSDTKEFTKKHWLPITLISAGALGMIIFMIVLASKNKTQITQ